jgi:hypothetical protein
MFFVSPIYRSHFSGNSNLVRQSLNPLRPSGESYSNFALNFSITFFYYYASFFSLSVIKVVKNKIFLNLNIHNSALFV